MSTCVLKSLSPSIDFHPSMSFQGLRCKFDNGLSLIYPRRQCILASFKVIHVCWQSLLCLRSTEYLYEVRPNSHFFSVTSFGSIFIFTFFFQQVVFVQWIAASHVYTNINVLVFVSIQVTVCWPLDLELSASVDMLDWIWKAWGVNLAGVLKQYTSNRSHVKHWSSSKLPLFAVSLVLFDQQKIYWHFVCSSRIRMTLKMTLPATKKCMTSRVLSIIKSL